MKNFKTTMVLAILFLLAASTTALAQNIDQLLESAATGNLTARFQLVNMGADAVPIIHDAMVNKWPFHAHSEQRNNMVGILDFINDVETVPALKYALILEPSTRKRAVDALLRIDDLSISAFIVDTLADEMDYQQGTLQLFERLLEDEIDLIEVLSEMYDEIALNHPDYYVIDQAADLLAKLVLKDKPGDAEPFVFTREAIQAALLALQNADETTKEIDINDQIFEFLHTKIGDDNVIKRRLALRTVNRLIDLTRGLGQANKLPLRDYEAGLISTLLDQKEDMLNRSLAAKSLELLPLSQNSIVAFVTALAEPGLDREVKFSAVRALETAGIRLGDRVYKVLNLVPELEPAMRWRLSSALVHVGRRDEAVVGAIKELLDNPDADLRYFAIQLLGALKDSAREAVPELFAILDHESNADLKTAIINTLVRIVPDDPEVIQLAESLVKVKPVINPRLVKLPAFPGAEGRGMYAKGGRGGEVYIVTNLNDSGSGSLRDAVSRPNRTVVFAVSGDIKLRSQLRVANNITIAGHTAPGDGITVRDYPTLIAGSDTIVRFMRFRLGEEFRLKSDALNIERFIENVIVDHISVSWGIDEVFTTYSNSETTVQWSMIGEGLNYMNHSCGGLWGPRSSYHHNLIHNNKTRNPKLAYLDGNPGGEIDYVNNLVYNWWQRSVYTGSQGQINMVNNYFKPGPSTNSGVRARLIEPDGANVRLYLVGNVMEGADHVTADNWKGVAKEAVRRFIPYNTLPITTHSAEEAYELVLEKAGAYLPRRDAVDERIVNQVREGTGQIIIRPAEVGGFPILNSDLPPVDTDKDGMPDMWEIYHGLDPFNQADRNHDRTGDGYTNLEEYLHTLTEDHVLWGRI